MQIKLDEMEITTASAQLAATLMAPARALPGVLFVHGWGGSQAQDLGRAREAAGLGSVCLTFDLRGHEGDVELSRTVTRAQNLDDLIGAYDWLAGQPNVDAAAIAVVGVSYGAYLAAILTSLRAVRWLSLRSPALYADERWDTPKFQLHLDMDLPAYRSRRIDWSENRALRACAAFGGDVLIIEAQHDTIVPHTVIENYVAAFGKAKSLTSRVVAGADHAFSHRTQMHEYTTTLINWLTEMIVGGRQSAAKARLDQHEQARAVAG